MACKYLSANIIRDIIATAETVLQRKLTTIEHILFPNSICITDQLTLSENQEQFILIFDVKVNYQGVKIATIRYIQIPLCLQHHGLGSKIYQTLEDQFKSLGCQRVTVEATTIGFWQHLDFKVTYQCYPDDDVCPMQKDL